MQRRCQRAPKGLGTNQIVEPTYRPNTQVNMRRVSKETDCRLDDDVELNVLGCRVDILGTNCDSMVQCCFTSTETVRLVRTGSPGRPPQLPHSS